MSSALAIAAVTAVLKSLLENSLISQGVPDSLGGSFSVTVLPPEPPNTANGNSAQPDRLNLFLYQTSPNTGWRNVSLPSRDANGERLTNPPLALNLHYLLTAFSKEPLHAEIMLGYAMQLLHEVPILTRDTIRTILSSLASSTEAAERAIAVADLADQVEQIKLCPESMGPEEISKLWTAFHTSYHPTAAYQASVVLIESRRSTRSALPVLRSQLHVMPFRQPTIATVLPQIVTQGSLLTLQGQNLKADTVSVRFGAVSVAPSSLNDTQIQVTVPTGLQAGINTVQVIQPLDFPPTGEHQGFESNLMPFMLRPSILAVTADDVTAGMVNVTLQVEPVIGRAQRVVLRLNEQGSGTAAYTVTAAKRETDANSITIPIKGLKAGSYRVRLQVDGAESLPGVDTTDPDKPVFTEDPNVTIACAGNCLRSPAIALSSTVNGDVLTVTGSVTVQDETTTPVPSATVTITWTLPDGSTRNDVSTTGSTGANRGVVTFTLAGSRGTYTLTVVNIAKTVFSPTELNYSFDPPQSTTLSASITG